MPGYCGIRSNVISIELFNDLKRSNEDEEAGTFHRETPLRCVLISGLRFSFLRYLHV